MEKDWFSHMTPILSLPKNPNYSETSESKENIWPPLLYWLQKEDWWRRQSLGMLGRFQQNSTTPPMVTRPSIMTRAKEDSNSNQLAILHIRRCQEQLTTIRHLSMEDRRDVVWGDCRGWQAHLRSLGFRTHPALHVQPLGDARSRIQRLEPQCSRLHKAIKCLI